MHEYYKIQTENRWKKTIEMGREREKASENFDVSRWHDKNVEWSNISCVQLLLSSRCHNKCNLIPAFFLLLTFAQIHVSFVVLETFLPHRSVYLENLATIMQRADMKTDRGKEKERRKHQITHTLTHKKEDWKTLKKKYSRKRIFISSLKQFVEFFFLPFAEPKKFFLW